MLLMSHSPLIPGEWRESQKESFIETLGYLNRYFQFLAENENKAKLHVLFKIRQTPSTGLLQQ